MQKNENEVTGTPAVSQTAVATNAGKEWANPTPAGLVALAVACACFFALLTGRIEASAMPLIGCWLIGGFVIQIVVALLDLKEGNQSGGSTFLFFSAFFMLVSGLEMFVKHNAGVAGISLDATVDGYAWSVLAVVVILWTPVFFKKFSFLSLIVMCLNVSLPIIALMDLGVIPKAGFASVAAWALLVAGAIAVYYSAVLIVNGAYGRKIYPTL